MNEEVMVSDLTDEDLFLYTQRKRMRLAEEITKTRMPTDTTEQSVFLSLLNDMDKQVINRRKLVVDEKVADSASAVANTMEQLFGVFGNSSPLSSKGEVVSTHRPALPDKLAEITLVPGELDMGTQKIELREIEGDA